MRATRLTLITLLAAITLFCCSCQGRVTSTPQAVSSQEAAPSQESSPSQEAAPSQNAVPSQETGAPETVPAPNSDSPIDYQTAAEAVLAQHAGALPLKCSLDYDDGLTLYEIDVLGADGVVYEVQVDAMSGALLRTETDDDGTRYTKEMIAIPYAQAVSTAMESFPGCTFESFEIDTNAGGTVVYEVEVLDSQRWEQDVEVDASTGAIVTGSAQAAPAPATAAPVANAGTGSGNSGHHPDAHHNTGQGAASPLTENMLIISADSPDSALRVCDRCGQSPCICVSSAPAVCAACGQNPCACYGTSNAGGRHRNASRHAGHCGY